MRLNIGRMLVVRVGRRPALALFRCGVRSSGRSTRRPSMPLSAGATTNGGAARNAGRYPFTENDEFGLISRLRE